MADVVVVGQIGRDLVLRVRALPDAGSSADALERRELLGGKGANQAVALAQLGRSVAMVGVVGDDAAGTAACAQAAANGVDVSSVARRPGGRTALLLDLVESGGRRRLVESVDDEVLIRVDDVRAAAGAIRTCSALVLQLQTPGDAVRAALEAVRPDALVVADGAPAGDATRAAVLRRADVLRADLHEAAQWAGRPVDGVDAVRRAARELLSSRPALVALGAGDDGNLVAWAGDDLLLPLLGDEPVDPTGGGDAYVAALTAARLAGAGPRDAAWSASAAAALTVLHPGGRPELSRAALAAAVHRFRGS